MDDLHSLLQRQLKRHFPQRQLPAGVEPFLSVVNQAYQQFDDDRAMLERSLDLSSQELLHTNAALRALMSAFPDQLLRLSHAGEVLEVRGGGVPDSARRWTTGHALLPQLTPDARALVEPVLGAVAEHQMPVNVEIEIGPAPHRRVYEARLIPIADGEILMILRDVTERHFAEMQLRASQLALHEAHRELESRVEERTAALAHANAELRREIAERFAAESERNRLEEQLRHAQKMEAIGRLAGGIAHDFNNLLTAVQGYSELLRHALKDSPLRADVEEIYRAAERASTLTRQLLAFSRRQLLSPEVLDLNARLMDTTRMLRRVIGEHIAIDLHLAADVWTIRADAAQLEQSVVNLAVNARDAMPDGGALTLETRNRTVAAADARVLEIAPGAYVELRVSDTGAGIAEDVRRRIFEPFFTTKGKGAGTGLGLAMVYGFVHQSGGTITVDSAPGHGTTFTLLLPRVEIDSAAGDTAAVPLQPAVPGAGTVLIVEDERALRRLAATVVGQAGYDTLEAADGQEALDLFAEHADRIALVVTDVVMPRMGGRELAERLLRQRPALPLIYMTGYAEEGDALRKPAPGASMLLKPFSPDLLLRTIGEALRRRPA